MTRHPLRYIVVATALVATLPPAAPAAANETPQRSGAGVLSGAEVSGGDASTAMPATLQLAATRSLAHDADPAYRIGVDGRGANPRHGLRLVFTPEGAQIATAPGAAASHGPRVTNYELALRLERFGRDAGDPVHPTPPRIDGAWVEYDRGAGLREWFVNLPQGVEQGWTVTQRPAGDGPLMLELDTGRSPDRVEDERLAWSRLDYHGLVALDAEGRELPARWISDGARLRIEVDDTAAAYPLVIDPWLQQAKLTADDGLQGDQFGFSVTLSADGNTALVGAWAADVDDENAGAAYVFVRSGKTWTLQAKLTADDPGTHFQDQFGNAVDLSDDGNTALIGEHNDGINQTLNRGAAFVFTRSGETWTQRAKLVANDGMRGDFFGDSVALSGAGDVVVVGAIFAAVNGNDEQGAAYVFTGGGGVWTQRAKLVADDGAAGDHFGRSVAISGDTVIVGTSDSSAGQGAAYVFTRSGAEWNQQAKLTAVDGVAGDRFGLSVALFSDTAVVGARAAAVDGNSGQGAAYVFTRSGAQWSQQTKLTAADGAAGDNFGHSVALSGDTALVVGATGASGQGAAYVFARGGTEWNEQAKLTSDDGAPGDLLGYSVAVSGNTAVVGARLATVNGNDNQGAAYIFIGTLAPAALEVDFDPLPASDGNDVFEPGERVEMAPGWRNAGAEDEFADGILSNFVGPEGGAYDIVLDNAGYGPILPGEIGSCRDAGTGCYQLDVQMTGSDRPAQHWDATVGEEVQTGPDDAFAHTWTLHLGDSFEDVPRDHLFYSWIETLIHSEVTVGCTLTEYCPGNPNTRGQMAVFVLKSFEGPEYVAPACEPDSERMFDDVPADHLFCSWIEELARREVVAGCDANSYCPGDPVSRAQMSIFLLKTLLGADYVPPECSGLFADVPCPSLFANWIEDLFLREITSGCQLPESYCPSEPNTRGQMAVFLTRTFGLQLYGP